MAERGPASCKPGSRFALRLPAVPAKLNLELSKPLGVLKLILVAAAAGAPMQSRDRVLLEPGRGIVGDRYHARLGYWSDPKWPDQEITLIEDEVAIRLGVAPESLRRNIVTSGVDLGSLLGTSFRIGVDGPELRGIRICEPCSYIEGFTRAGMLRDLAGGNGGLRATIVRGGWISAGDPIILLP